MSKNKASHPGDKLEKPTERTLQPSLKIAYQLHTDYTKAIRGLTSSVH